MKFLLLLTTISSLIASPLRTLEKKLIPKYNYIIGVDEAGRGALAGPVTAAAVCATYNLKNSYNNQNDNNYNDFDINSIDLNALMIEGVNDSKVLSAKRREKIYEIITSQSPSSILKSNSIPTHENNNVIYSCKFINEKTIDEINILEASMLAMKQSIEDLITTYKLESNECYAIIDGNKTPTDMSISTRPLIKGDSLCYPCSLASIIAKVSRDRFMIDMNEIYPEYGFDKHKGYATKQHIMAIHKYGPSPIHRLSFKPIKGRDSSHN